VSKFDDLFDNEVLIWVRHVGSFSQVIAIFRVKPLAPYVAALGCFAPSTSLEASLDETPLKLSRGTHDLPQESALWVIRIVAYDLGTFSGFEDTDVVACSPGMSECYLLDMQLAGEPIGPVNHEAIRKAIVEGDE
jgi:hypothetical protein